MKKEKLHHVPKIYNYLNKLPKILRVHLKILKKRRINVSKNLKKNIYSGKLDKTILVLGIPRSGTSMVGNILSKLGVYMSEEKVVKMEGNVQGFFESGHFANMDDKILAYSKGLWNEIPSEKDILEQKNNREINQDIKKLIKSNQKKIWGWKGIRTSLTIPLYHPYLTNPHYIFIFRNPLSSCKSIEKGAKKYWNKMDFYACFDLYLEYSQRLLNFARKINSPKLFLAYEDILNNPQKEINKIKKFLKIKKEIDPKFIDKKYKHF